MVLKFVKTCFVFGVIVWVISLPIYFIGEDLYFKLYKKHSLEFKSYLLSDSHAAPLEDFLQKKGIYNFSVGSDSYFDMSRKLNYLINKTKVDTIYITVNDHALSSYREQMNNLDRSVYYASSADYNNLYLYTRDKLEFLITLFQSKTKELTISYIKSRLKTNQNEDYHSKIILETNWKDLEEFEKKAFALKRYYTHFEKANQSEKLLKQLEEIVKVCKRKQIHLIGIYFPLSKEYLELLGESNNEAVKLFENEGLTVLNFKTKFQNKEELFQNQDHLNPEGGKVLADMILNQIE